MAGDLNALRWDGGTGHYEVYYLSATDRGSGVGLWIRYTMVAPRDGEATCSLWFMAMDPEGNPGQLTGRKHTLPATELHARTDPFELRIGDAVLSDRGMTGGFEDVSWDLNWELALPAAEHVHPFLQRAKIAKTVLVLPHPAVEVAGTVEWGGRKLELDGCRGGQAHLWGSKHAARWAWAHCNDFEGLDGGERPDTWIDGVSVFVPRFGRLIGPNSPIVGRFAGRDFRSTSPLRVTRNPSRFGLTSWHLEATDGDLQVVADVDAPREQLVGVTYHDPDGDLAYCYNSETASMRVRVWRRDKSVAEGRSLVDELVSRGRAHFEYAQREPVPGLELHVR
jgi:hypothetical protein